jgi:hypothetical protein
MVAMTGHTREEIIAAIQQATAHDGGKPVGMVRFQTLTRITRRAWQGVYWATWGDALREAGLEPNTLAQRRDEDELLADAVKLVRHLGKVPAETEWRMARRSNPTLPSRTALRALGGRDRLTAKLRELAESDPAYADLLDLLPEPVADAVNYIAAQDILPPPASPSVTGYVYLGRMGKRKDYKIGSTRAVGRRIDELSIQLPERLIRVHVLFTDDPKGIETYWHKRFESKWTGNGEWFWLSPEDVAAFKRRGDYM